MQVRGLMAVKSTMQKKVDNLFNKKELMEEYIKSQREGMAEFCKVPLECVRTISKEEYDSNTDDD